MQQSFCYQLRKLLQHVSDSARNYGNVWNVFLYNVEELQCIQHVRFKLFLQYVKGRSYAEKLLHELLLW